MEPTTDGPALPLVEVTVAERSPPVRMKPAGQSTVSVPAVAATTVPAMGVDSAESVNETLLLATIGSKLVPLISIQL